MTKRSYELFCIFFLLIFCWLNASSAQAPGGYKVSPVGGVREYLPGDFVHVIVEAPPDTSQINATMPDRTTLSLIQERRRNVWRGIWEVPIDFKKGTYTANLQAIDLEGNVFEGKTEQFVIGELALVTLAQKATLEAAPKSPLAQIIKIEEPGAPGVPGKRVITSPSAAPPLKLTSREKKELIERNLIAAKADLEKGRFSEAAAYFRIVLYLEPKHEAAARYLSEAQEKAAAEAKNRFRSALFIVVFAGLLIILAVSLLIIRIFLFKPAPAARAAPEALSASEKQKRWYQKMEWQKNPFTPDLYPKEFIGVKKLELDGLKNFIKARIESVDGKTLAPFTDSALEKIFELSKGNPKSALAICNCALKLAMGRNENIISAEIISECQKIIPANILIADDEKIVRTTLDSILRIGGGYRTGFAADGEEAIEKIKENGFDLVLLDIDMPKLNGYEVLRQARAIHPTLPVVFISGKGTPKAVMDSLSHFDLAAYIEKPFTPEKVLDVVAKVLKAQTA